MKLLSVVQSSTLQLSQVNGTCLEGSRECGFTPSDRGDEVTSQALGLRTAAESLNVKVEAFWRKYKSLMIPPMSHSPMIKD